MAARMPMIETCCMISDRLNGEKNLLPATKPKMMMEKTRTITGTMVGLPCRKCWATPRGPFALCVKTATLLSLSNQSDVIRQLTDWVTHDPAARKFIAGEPDQWGMVVNPNYEGLALPAAEIPLLDDFVPETGNTCRQENPAVYFNQIATDQQGQRVA